MTINLKENYENRVKQVWQDYKNLDFLNEKEAEYRLSPILPEIVDIESILFIGVNPSFRKGAVIQDENKQIEFYTISKDEYFEKFKEIARYCGNHKWSHIDLLFIRETKQKLIEKQTYTSVEFIKFINAQLEISFEIIEKAKPKIIVVSNALASEFFGKMKPKHTKYFDRIWRGFDLDFDNELGCYWVHFGDLKIPIVFSGMLSGQRALDIGSLERLKWQIKRILFNKKPGRFKPVPS